MDSKTNGLAYWQKMVKISNWHHAYLVKWNFKECYK